MATYVSPAAAADQAKAIASAAEVGIHKERILEAFDRMESVGGVSGPWTMGTWLQNVATLKEMQTAFTGSGVGKGLGMYAEQAEHMLAQMQIDDVGLVYSLV